MRSSLVLLRRLRHRWVVSALGVALAGCATYEDDLARAQRAYEANDHERALAIFRALEPDAARLSVGDRAHYAYLRGMTDYRIGYRGEARHWLSIAAAIDTGTPNSLPAEWNKRMGDTLKELNEEVYTSGVSALANAKGKTGDKAGDSTLPEKNKPATADDE
jgi:hypothetical protein